MKGENKKMTKKQATALNIARYFTQVGQDAYDLLEWRRVDAKILNYQTQEVIFEHEQVEFPVFWSQNAVNIVAQKYFAGDVGEKGREDSLKTLINRVVLTIAQVGAEKGYFANSQEKQVFIEELKYILATQRASFNSPVWFNIGVADRAQQASACFILKVEDDMRSILRWYKEEGLIFKGGSGAGLNVSNLRSSVEGLSTSIGKASGPVSFMRGADASAGSITSGGRTRRAAKMVVLNVDHPDIEDFIWCKAHEERKAQALIDAGFDMGVDGKDIFSIQYQNANNSVRVSDAFMTAVEKDEQWALRAVNDPNKRVLKTVSARDLFQQICQAAWQCADPGLQFDDTINSWHTTPNAGRINASNPCSEYMHLDNSACNLASLNLLKFVNEKGEFLTTDFLHTVDLMILAQEILVGYSDYPTKAIGETARAYRQLGLGYANLGALLMSWGLPYDSDAGRAQAAVITSLMTGQAYLMSAKIAQRLEPFAGYAQDRANTLAVIDKHRQKAKEIYPTYVKEELLTLSATIWDDAHRLGSLHGVRNAQVSVLAPTGTIGLMMDCDTTGIEPELALVKLKTLVGGGHMEFVNQTVQRGLQALSYSSDQVQEIAEYMTENHSIIGAPHLAVEHLPVFACSIGDNIINASGHIKMMSAVQPFLSGAISKTVNMPEEASVDDVREVYTQAWQLGLKAIAIYRDNCKVSQPLTVKKQEDEDLDKMSSLGVQQNNLIVKGGVVKRRLSPMRNSKTFKFRIADTKGYMTVGEFEDGTPGEIFIIVAKQGSTLAGVMDALAISISYGLQHGVPLKNYVKGFINTSFAPAGPTEDPQIRFVTSFVDYIFRKLAHTYLSYDDLLDLGIVSLDADYDQSDEQATLIDQKKIPAPVEEEVMVEVEAPAKPLKTNNDFSSPMCTACGNQTHRSGSCYVCRTCGLSTGCS